MSEQQPAVVRFELSAARFALLVAVLKWSSEIHGYYGELAWSFYKELLLAQGVRIVEPEPKKPEAPKPVAQTQNQREAGWFKHIFGGRS